MPRKPSRAAAGYVRRLPSGRYQASHVYEGTRYTAPSTFTAKIDADAWLRDRLVAVERGEWSPQLAAERRARAIEQAQTLGTYSQTWITERTNSRGEHLRPRTAEEYRRLLRGPLAPLLDIELRQITPATVRTWRTRLLDTGRATTTARAYGLLNAIMGTAVTDDLIPSNPCSIRGGQATTTGRKVVPPTDEELATILDAITPRYRALVALAAAGGLRYGEAIALRARDLVVEDDGQEGVVVRVDVVRGVVRTADGLVAGPPKTSAGVRRVAIFGEDAQIIADHLAGRVPGTRRIIGDALVFPAADGAGFLPQSAFWKHWHRARVAAGRADMPVHALRHFSGTRFAQVGATPREVMARLGHSSMGAAARYQHSGSRDDELAARMARGGRA